MTVGRPRRTAACDSQDARVLLAHARSFAEVAERVFDDYERAEFANVIGSLAVLAGIAASDAACCAALGQRSRSSDHHDAINVVAQVRPHGAEAAKDLRRLLNLKDAAEYGVMHVGEAELKNALRCARRIVEFAVRAVNL